MINLAGRHLFLILYVFFPLVSMTMAVANDNRIQGIGMSFWRDYCSSFVSEWMLGCKSKMRCYWVSTHHVLLWDCHLVRSKGFMVSHFLHMQHTFYVYPTLQNLMYIYIASDRKVSLEYSLYPSGLLLRFLLNTFVKCFYMDQRCKDVISLAKFMISKFMLNIYQVQIIVLPLVWNKTGLGHAFCDNWLFFL